MTAYSEIFQFLTSGPSLEEIIAFRPSEAALDRAYYLASVRDNGTITPEEQNELDEFIRMKKMMGMLRKRARQRLGRVG